MSRLALTLVLLSCFSHAAWNLIAKRQITTFAFFWLANLFATLVAMPFILLFQFQALARLPAVLLSCLLVTAVCQAAYFCFLAGAYRHGDISAVYPIARMAPLFVAPLAGLVEGVWPSRIAFAGIVTAVLGCFTLSAPEKGVFPVAKLKAAYLNRANLLAIATAITSAGYTVCDSIGVRIAQRQMPGASGAFLYGGLEWFSTTLFLTAPAMASQGAVSPGEVWQTQRSAVMCVGALSFFTYLLVLWAYSVSREVAYVAALRQFSIVLGVVGGGWFLKERVSAFRGAGALIIMAGLVIVALAR
ncbi:MAG TPA: DMT family transporter [Chthonomonadales bacterium]|nr:DMT family transporter [Chthonomonadales bacterium]